MSFSFRLTALTVKIPEDILLEIIARLPADSLMRFKCVSKLWSSLISSRYFTNLFFKFSSCRRVFVFTTNFKMFSSSPINLVEAASFLPLNLDLTLPDFQKDRLYFENAVRGLMCFMVGREIQKRIEREIRIINFTTRQVLSLPLRKSNMFFENDSSIGDYEFMWNYFGYDPVSDEYKVLSTISSFSSRSGVRSETQVLVLGVGASWRNTKISTTSPPPHHRPVGKGININSVLYYAAWSHEDIYVLMRFDLYSEEFNLIEFPIEMHTKWNEWLHIVYFMNYQNQVALLDDSRLNTQYILDLWVLEEYVGKSKWSLKFFVLPCQQLGLTLGVGAQYLGIRGTSRSGEITLYGGDNHVFYNLERNHIIRGVVINPSFNVVDMTLWDDVESIMFLEA